MPVFEYVCDNCGREFEELVRSAEGGKRVSCPACSSGRVKRKISTFSSSSSPSGAGSLPMGGCGRCGDPSGPCGLD